MTSADKFNSLHGTDVHAAFLDGLNQDEFKQCILDLRPHLSKRLRAVIKKYPNIKRRILDSSPGLKLNGTYDLDSSTMFRYLVCNTFELQFCPECGKLIDFNNINLTYDIKEHFCSTKCCAIHYGSLRKGIKTGPIPLEVKQSVEWKEMLQRKREKTRKTSISKYGVEHPSQAQCVKDKVKQTVYERYGSSCVFSCPAIVDKIQQTNLKRYGSISPLGNRDIIHRSIKTRTDRYGDNLDISQMSDDQITKRTERYNKRVETCLQRYGVTNVMLLEDSILKLKNTSLEKYGVDWPSRSEQVKQKIKDTVYSRYGVYSVLQVPEIKQK